MLYPIGIQSFSEIRRRGFVYVDKTAKMYKMVSEDALEQIDAKGYCGPYRHDGRKLIRIGANFSSELRNIEKWIIE